MTVVRKPRFSPTIYREHDAREEFYALKRKVEHVLPVHFDGIPAELQAINQWVLWKYAAYGKRPIINPRNGEVASVTDQQTWGTFEQAHEKYQSGRYHGIGLVLTNTGIVGIDLDHCVTAQGLPIRDASDVIEFMQSYGELSPSGTGVHIYAYGEIPGNRKAGNFEMYSTARYLSITGHRLIEAPYGIMERQGELDYLYSEKFLQRTLIPTAPRGNFRTKPDSDVIQLMLSAKNAHKTRPLWEGQWAKEFASQSEADLQMVRYLRYWTGGDVEQMDRLFRQSGLMRSKWDEGRGGLTYGERTIQAVMQG